MKQKYMAIKKSAEELVIREYGELFKDTYTLTCEETYAAETIQGLLAGPAEELVAKIRTVSFFPPSYCADKISAALNDLMANTEMESIEVLVDDMDCITKPEKEEEKNAEAENVEIDELLDDDEESDSNIDEDDEIISSISGTDSGKPASIKLADDETLDTDGNGS